MGDWSKVEHEIWRDEPLMALSTGAKLMFVYSFTHSPEASLTGLSVVSERKLGRVLGSRDDVEAVLDELGLKPFVKYDWDAELLWCVNRMARAHSTSPKWLAGARNVLDRMPPSPLLKEFKSRYRNILRDGNS